MELRTLIIGICERSPRRSFNEKIERGGRVGVLIMIQAGGIVRRDKQSGQGGNDQTYVRAL